MSAAELESDLRCFLADRPISARRVSQVERLIRWSRRNPVIASLSGVTVVLLLLVAVVGVVGYRAERAQRNRAEETSTLALNALDQIFDRFAPDQAVVLTSSADDDGSSPAVVSDETAALLEDLLEFYDQLGKSDDDDLQLAIKRAEARRRVGDIRQRLGRHEDAIRSYRESLTRYEALRERGVGQAETFAITQARILNGIGTSQRMINQQAAAKESHERALATIEAHFGKSVSNDEAEFELARTHYLLAWRLRPGEGPVDDVSQLIVPEDLDEGPPHRSPPGGFSGREGPPSGRPLGLRPSEGISARALTGDQASQFATAVSILNRLRAKSPDDPKVAHLLAICLREWHPARIPDEQSPIVGQNERPEELLEELVRRFPKTPEFQHALAVTYSNFHFRPGDLSMVELDRVEKALAKALVRAKKLYADQPTVPAYARSLIQVSFHLAITQQSLPRFLGPGNRDMAQQKFSQAERNYRAATELQRSLARRFPQSLSYHLWLARYRRTLSVVLQMQRRPEEARDELLAAIAEAEQIDRDRRNTDSWHLMLSSLHRELGNIYERMEEPDLELELEHLFRARDHQSQIRDRSVLDSRARDRPPPDRPFDGPARQRFP